MKPKSRTASSSDKASTKRKWAHRARPTPSWLKEQQDLDEMARRRCLMVLSVLSGEKPVTDAIAEAGISRGLYYQLEEKALRAMLRVLAPGIGAETSGNSAADGMVRRISELEEQLKAAQQERRRAERLLYLTRKMVKPGRIASVGRGRPPKTQSSSTKRGARSSTSSESQTKLDLPQSAPPSMPTTDGETGS